MLRLFQQQAKAISDAVKSGKPAPVPDLHSTMQTANSEDNDNVDKFAQPNILKTLAQNIGKMEETNNKEKSLEEKQKEIRLKFEADMAAAQEKARLEKENKNTAENNTKSENEADLGDSSQHVDDKGKEVEITSIDLTNDVSPPGGQSPTSQV